MEIRGNIAEGKEFAKIRQQMGYTQAQLAQEIGKSLRSVQNYESAEWPIPESVKKLVDFMARERAEVAV